MHAQAGELGEFLHHERVFEVGVLFFGAGCFAFFLGKFFADGLVGRLGLLSFCG